jgi:hypothetical protein
MITGRNNNKNGKEIYDKERKGKEIYDKEGKEIIG